MIRRNYQLYGADGLIDRLPGPRGPHGNRTEDIEKAILDRALEHPGHGCLQVAQELALQGIQVSSNGRQIELTGDQIRLLERFSPEFRERHIETHAPGDPVAVDTFFVGTLKGVGKVDMQTVLDCYSRHAGARLYTSKFPVTAVHVLNEAVLPFFDEHEASIRVILSSNGREFCGRADQHPWSSYP